MDAIHRAERKLRDFITSTRLPEYKRRELAEILDDIRLAQIDLADAEQEAENRSRL